MNSFPLFVIFFCVFQDDFFKFYSDESDGLSLEDTDDASESETYHNRSIDQCSHPQTKQMKDENELPTFTKCVL